jgi:hypothetical protein
MPAFIFIGGRNPGSQIITVSGSGTLSVPYFTENLRVRAWGAGAGGQGMTGTSGVTTGMVPGGNTTFGSLSAGGGNSFNGGTASGGDSNINGNNASTPNGSAAPRTDLGGGAQRPAPVASAPSNGLSGNPYGGGGTSGVSVDGGNPWVGAGGGSGAFVEKVYTPITLPPGTTVSYSVGAGGTGGDGASVDGGSGANGALVIEWDY